MKVLKVILIIVGVVFALHVVALVGVYFSSRAMDRSTARTAPLTPDTSAPNPAPAKNPTPTYTIKKGDTLVKIARAHGVSTAELCQLNQIDDPDKIQLAQVLQLPRKN